MNGPAAETKKWKIARSFPRFAVDVPISIHGPALAGSLTGRIADVGLGGVCAVFAEQKLRGGERLWVEFTLPRAIEPLRILAKLKYIAGERHGFQFLNLAPRQREQIRSACEGLVIV
jgi:c-di-GMP-binding flagellar brake protein YcgR